MKQIFAPLFVLAAILGLPACNLFPKTVKVGSKNSTTQMLLGEIAAQQLESKGMKIVRRIGLGNTAIVHQATISGDIDIYPEDTSSAIGAMLKENSIQDPESQYERVRAEYDRLFGLKAMRPLGARNAPAVVVSQALAAKDNFTTVTSAADSRLSWRIGATEEFFARNDGMQSFSAAYKFQQKEAPRTLEIGALYQSLSDGQLDLVLGNESDGYLAGPAFKTLRDDRNIFSPGQLLYLVRKDSIAANPELEAALAKLSGKISTNELRQMGRAVDIDKRPLGDVARDFLKKAGL